MVKLRAIVNVKPNNQYFKYNGLTYHVIDYSENIITLSIDKIEVEFNFDEIIIIDLQTLYELYFNVDDELIDMLNNYIDKNKIQFYYPF